MQGKIEIFVDGERVGTHLFPNAGVVVGSDLSCDLIVGSAPAQWFRIDNDGTAKMTVTILSNCVNADEIPMSSGTPIDIRKAINLSFDRLRVRICSEDGRKGWLGTVLPKDGMPRFSFPAIGTIGKMLVPHSRELNYKIATACLGLFVLSAIAMSGGFIRFASNQTSAFAAAAIERPIGKKVDRTEEIARNFITSLQRIGLDKAITLSKSGDIIQISGTLPERDLETIRALISQAQQGETVHFQNLTEALLIAPDLTIRSYGMSPQFLVLGDGRLVQPGESVGNLWILRSVEAGGFVIARGGQTKTISF